MMNGKEIGSEKCTHIPKTGVRIYIRGYQAVEEKASKQKRASS